MFPNKRQFMATALIALGLSGAAFAAVSPEEAKQLGGATLTMWGAEKAGNKDGTIPGWTGQIKIPAGYDPKNSGVRPDPFADEKPLFSITAQNVDKYAEKVTEGLKAMFKKYPTFRMDVFPTHRTVEYPKYVLENTVKNATSCKLSPDGNAILGCYGGLPFPIPKTGAEAMWNKNAAFKAFSWGARFTNWYVDSNGRMVMQSDLQNAQESPFYDPSVPGVRLANAIYYRYRGDLTGPPSKAGNALLLQDPLDQVNVGRRIWQYIPGQRRVKLAPDLAYDTPTPESGGSQNMDDAQVFLGAIDRFDWKLLGKKEVFIPYNAYKFHDGKACPNKVKFTKNHLNPDCVRWELHRTWVVQGTLKKGFRHIYSKRIFYWDEDAPQSGVGDNFDGAGNVYRVSYNMGIPLYEGQAFNADAGVTNDVQTGVYAISGEVAETGGWRLLPQKPATFFTPEDLAASGIR